jgi:hypothetical protein
VGFGQITQKSDDPLKALEPIALAAEAARRAEADAGTALLAHVDSVRDLTTTGSLMCFGGPGSNHPLPEMIGAPSLVESGSGDAATNLWRPA